MKKCPKCGRENPDDTMKCPSCGEDLPAIVNLSQTCKVCGAVLVDGKCPVCKEDNKKPFIDRIPDIIEDNKKGIISCALIAAFVLGFAFKSCNGIKMSDYEEVIQQKNKMVESKDALQKEFDAYKEKMKPYEEQQQADVKAAEEKAKKEAEEKAKKEAEAKAAQEAQKKKESEEKAATAKANSFGVSLQDFIKQFNVNCSVLGAGLVADSPNTSGSNDFVHITTSNPTVTLDISTAQGYVKLIYLEYSNTGASDPMPYAYASVAAAQIADKSTSVNSFSSMMNEMIQSAAQGQDVSRTVNGVKYTMNAEPGSFLLQIAK